MDRETLVEKIADLERRLIDRAEEIAATKTKIHFRAVRREDTTDLQQRLTELEALQEIDQAEHAELKVLWENLPLE